ncbi:hypothetical protein HN014_21545 [Aquimarina sp. TRL1]|uniref:hypothetical protein n=1 Tax=Aquimarina sp. (strain TRL1) TaxID=2736252 RepID=UPI00158B032C|nr:hypothetical protein [Aquimarina sp. TRL1]QKX07388.1 hypothetical protein HN014_21545 [Aquimarina sp. TRL1]
MNEQMERQKNSLAKNEFGFNKKLLAILPHLTPYVKHRLYIAESTGILPRNMYCADDIIDEALLLLHESTADISLIDQLSLELKLFRISGILLDELYAKEGWHQQNISTSFLLKNELQKLEECFTSDSDKHLIMDEELNDICYRQKPDTKQSFVYDDTDSLMLSIIEPEASTVPIKQKLLGHFYSWLPLETSKIVDLFIFGKLNFEEIAIVMNTTAIEIKETIIHIRKSFRKHLV